MFKEWLQAIWTGSAYERVWFKAKQNDQEDQYV